MMTVLISVFEIQWRQKVAEVPHILAGPDELARPNSVH
jgi:hypothetical protein